MENIAVAQILERAKNGTDCNEDESAIIKGWLRETIIIPESGEQNILEGIQFYFPLEYGEHLAEMESKATHP